MIGRLVDRVLVFGARAVRAWRYRSRLGYSWRFAWIKAGWR